MTESISGDLFDEDTPIYDDVKKKEKEKRSGDDVQ